MTTPTDIGIDGIEIETGKLKLDLPETFAPERCEDPEKYTKGLGLYSSSLPDVNEDIVTMGANAAHRLMERKDRDLDDIGRIDVATETAFDASKPVSTYIAGCLEQVFDGDLHHANKGERKFACIAGTQALDDAYNWIAAGKHRGRDALVIATDTALYERGDPGEATQGAGAVAMLVSEDPDVTAIEREQGYGSADETDFLKPNQQFPSVDGQRSVQVYLTRMREALEDYESAAGAIHPEEHRFVPFHTPFPNMVQKAALLGYRHALRDTGVETDLAAEDGLGLQPREHLFDDRESYESAIRHYTDNLKETDRYQDWFDETVAPTLEISREVGNWYTGSVHLARASALQHAADNNLDVSGERMLVGSYGSGAQAEIHAEEIQDGWKDDIETTMDHLEQQLEERYDLDFAEYEDVHDAHNYDEESARADGFIPDPTGFIHTGTGEMGERTYTFVE